MSKENERIYFMDGVRTLVVLFVVILHAACAYSEIVPWWPVQEFPKEIPYTLIIVFFDLFCMPTLFFVAGFFTPGSMKSHGPTGFLRAKLLRLGGPFVLLGVFFVPIVSYVGYLGRTAQPDGFLDFWMFQISTAWKPTFVLIDSAKSALPHINDFSQWHLWFISLLLIFCFLAAIASRITPSFFQTDKVAKANGRTILLHMALIGAVATVLFGLTAMQIAAWSWATLGGYLMFQPARLGMYGGFFTLGIIARTRGWFNGAGIPGSVWLWLGAAIALDAAFLSMSHRFMEIPGPAPASLAFFHGFLRIFAALAWMGFLIKAATRWLNNPNPILTNLSKSSYDIYLLHLPIIVALQLAAVSLPIGFFPKFILESVLGILICWQLSQRLVLPYPKIAITFLLAVFAAACMIT